MQTASRGLWDLGADWMKLQSPQGIPGAPGNVCSTTHYPPFLLLRHSRGTLLLSRQRAELHTLLYIMARRDQQRGFFTRLSLINSPRPLWNKWLLDPFLMHEILIPWREEQIYTGAKHKAELGQVLESWSSGITPVAWSLQTISTSTPGLRLSVVRAAQTWEASWAQN